MLEKLFGFGSSDSGIEFNNPKQSYSEKTDPDDCLSCRAMGMTPSLVSFVAK